MSGQPPKLGADTSNVPISNVVPIKLPANPLGKVLGIDVSHYEPALSWEKAKASGVLWMLTKASEGTGHTDQMLHEHCQAASLAGVLTGSYHFFHASQDGAVQALRYLRAIEGMQFDLPPCLDWESSSADGQPSGIQQREALKWLDIVEKKIGRVPIIYGGESFLRDLKLPGLFARYPLWLAHYGVPENRLHVPAPWKQYWAWQYTDSESVAGLAPGHHVDANWFNGSIEQLKAFAAK